MKNILTVFGTRPEAIKMAPVILALKADKNICVKVCVTGQHREMLDQVLDVFKIIPDFDLDLMMSNQTLGSLTSGVIDGMAAIYKRFLPDLVLAKANIYLRFSGQLRRDQLKFYGSRLIKQLRML